MLLIAIVIAARRASAAEMCRGQLYCDTSKSLAAIADIVDFEVTIDGGQARYRQLPFGQIVAEVALFDADSGTVSDGRIEMGGGARTNVWQLSSRYSGQLGPGRMTLESVQDHSQPLQSRLSISRTDAQRRNASAFRLRHSQSLLRRRHRFSQAMVRSTIQRLGNTTNLPVSQRRTISMFTWPQTRAKPC